MNKGRSFRYQERTVDDLKERANATSGDFDDFIKRTYKKFKVHDGKNMIRILPPTWDDAKHYGYDIWINYGVGPDNQPYLSLSKMKNEKDPIAEAQRLAAREGDEKLARELQARKRILMWVIDRNAEDEGPLLWAAPLSVDKALATLSFDEDTGEIIFIDDPENGCDVRFYKEGTGLKTNYDAAKIKLQKPSPIHQDEKLQDQWLQYVQENPVPKCLQFYDYAYISNVFDGGSATSGKHETDEAEGAKTANVADKNGTGHVGRGTDDELPRRRASLSREDPVDDEPVTPRRRGTIAATEDPPFEGGSIRDRIRRRQEAAKAEVEDD